jgi:hypothetical protein
VNCCCFGAPTEAPDEEKGVQEATDVQLEVVRDVGGRPLFLTTRRFIRVRTYNLLSTETTASSLERTSLVPR